MVVANYGTDNVGVFLNNDTLLDIVVAKQGTNNVGVFLGSGNGLFADQMMVVIEYGSLPFSVVVGDFNNDQLLDMAVGNSETDNINILLQTCWNFHVLFPRF